MVVELLEAVDVRVQQREGRAFGKAPVDLLGDRRVPREPRERIHRPKTARASERRADANEKLLRVVRLREVVVRSGFELGEPGLTLAVRAQEDDRKETRPGIAPHRLADLRAGHPRQTEVEEQEIEAVAPHGLDGRHSIRRLATAVASVLEERAQRGPGVPIVLDDEDSSPHVMRVGRCGGPSQ